MCTLAIKLGRLDPAGSAKGLTKPKHTKCKYVIMVRTDQAVTAFTLCLAVPSS